MNRIFRLINTSQASLVGDYKTIEEAWEAVKTNKGKMILWEQTELKEGWIWKQRPLKFIPVKDQVTYEVKKWFKSVWQKYVK